MRETRELGAEGWTLNYLGWVYNSLGQEEEAFKGYKQALFIFKEIGDRWGEGEAVYNAGTLCFKQGRYDVALAGFLYAKEIFDELQNPLRTETQNWIEKIHRELGDEQFAALLTSVEPHAKEIVDQALNASTE